MISGDWVNTEARRGSCSNDTSYIKPAKRNVIYIYIYIGRKYVKFVLSARLDAAADNDDIYIYIYNSNL